jgi:hypothetical protein
MILPLSFVLVELSCLVPRFSFVVCQSILFFKRIDEYLSYILAGFNTHKNVIVLIVVTSRYPLSDFAS